MTSPLAVNGRSPDTAKAPGGRTILVVGDLMLDHTVDGHVARISPEAPVPVLTIEGERYGLGGAANVARNLTSLGARAVLLGVAGCDRYGARLCMLLGEAGIDAGTVLVTERPTTVKTRYVAGTQQLLRVDNERAEPIDYGEELKLTRRLRDMSADAVIVSDYAKGVVTRRLLQDVRRLARRWGAPVVVDPKGRDFTRFAGCTAITPNAAEAAAGTGVAVRDDAESETAGRVLREQTGSVVLITRGEAGLTLVTDEGAQHLPAHAVEVFDVAGAGDTLVAAFTLELARGASAYEAARVANIAAGLAVQARGVAAISADQLSKAISANGLAARPGVSGNKR